MTDVQLDITNVINHIHYLSEKIGPRVKGSRAEKIAADYIRNEFLHLGLDVFEQEFPVDYTTAVDYSLDIIEPPIGPSCCCPILLTPDTPRGGITSEIVYIEGIDDPQMGPQLEGKIVLWFCTALRGFDFPQMVKYRPAAVLAITPAPGVKVRHEERAVSSFSPYKPVPCFWIDWEEGMRLVRAGARKAHLSLHTEITSSTSQNIIAQLKGSEFPDDIIVVGGHYDCPPGVPGASDNASGVGLTLELARLYSQRGSKRTLRFAAWGSEEVRFKGSITYLEDLVKQDRLIKTLAGFEKQDRTILDKHLFYLNMDVLGMPLGQNACYVLAPPKVETTLQELCNELGTPHKFYHQWYGSDHELFAGAGIPSINLTREGPAAAYIHTIDDTMDMINAQQLLRVGSFIDTFIKETAAESENWPFDRQVPEESRALVKEKLIQRGLTPDFD